MEEISEGVFVESLHHAEGRDGFLCLQLEPGTETVDPGKGLTGLGRHTFDVNFGLILQNGTEENGWDTTTSPQQVVIDGMGRTIQLGGKSPGGPMVLLTVGAGVTLTLRNITLKGFHSNKQPLIKVNGGTLILERGAAIRDNGKGVMVGTANWEEGGTLVMNGGTISDNSAGGVIVGGNGVFTLCEGTISGNSSGGESHGGGGVHVHSGGCFCMEGGELKGNTAWGFDHPGNGGAVYVRSGGLFIMKGGEIRSNTASGDFGSWGMGGPAYGGGVFVEKARAIIKDTADIAIEDRGVSFVKTGGVIYGWDAEAGMGNNTTSGLGNTVYVHTDPARKYETTAGAANNLDSDTDEGWEK
jgi:hypothetical protein